MEKTCQVEAPTEFNGCFFKAPYIIDLSNIDNGKVTFYDEEKTVNNEKKLPSVATATSMANVIINLNGFRSTAAKIVISSSAQGHPIVTYYSEAGQQIDQEIGHE